MKISKYELKTLLNRKLRLLEVLRYEHFTPSAHQEIDNKILILEQRIEEANVEGVVL